MDTSSKLCSTRGYKWIHVAVTIFLSPIQDICRRQQGIQVDTIIQLVSGLHVSALGDHSLTDINLENFC